MEKQKILMLEDNNSDAELIKEELIVHKFDFTSELVETEKDFIAAIHGFKPDIILSDYNLPQFTGFEALKIAKKLVPDIPFIMITGSLSEETAADSIKRGAWDYILKENLTRLTSAIENALKLKEEKDKNKQAEKTLKASEERYRVLFETAKDSIFITDESGKFLDVNQAACKSLGYSKEELLKMRNQDLDYETTGYEAFKKIRNGLKEDITFEVNQIRKDGNLLPVEISGNSYFIEDKTLFIAIARDFSYRKQAEEKEKEHHKNIELLSKTAMQFVDFPHDKDIYTFIGEQLQELIVKDSYVIVNSTDTESKTLITRAIIGIGKLSEKVASLIGKNPTGMTYNVEDEDLVYLSDGKLHLYEEGLYGISLKTIPKTVCKSIEKLLNIKSIFTIGLIKDNKLFGTLSILLKEDTGELKNKQLIETFIKQASIAVQKKQAEDALKESNENYQQVISNITAVVWKADIGENGAFENTYFSPVLDELLELPAGTMKNDWDKYFGYIKPEYLERVNNAFREAIISPGKKIDCEYEVLKDNGQTVWVHSIGSRFEKNGKMYVFGSTSDITERKKAEKKINLLSNIVKQSMEGMAQVDLNGNLIFIN
ncbi:MAG: PAS domain S-box protein, partial [Parcubacteria group bacterium]|nr:PAS domain S-box protein [Parcubacteria group bacterium]